MLQTGDLREELQAAFPHADVHPMNCDCGHCRLGSDPIAARRERFVRIQAAIFGAAIVGFYLMALYFSAEIAAAFAPVPHHVEISHTGVEG